MTNEVQAAAEALNGTRNASGIARDARGNCVAVFEDQALTQLEARCEAAEKRVDTLAAACRKALARFRYIRTGGTWLADPCYLLGNEDVIGQLEAALKEPTNDK